MVIQPLDSTDNKTLRRLRSLLVNRGLRERQGVSVLEGVRLIEQARTAGVRFRTVVYGPRLVATDHGRGLVARLSPVTEHALYVTDRVLAELSDLETSQGILAVAPMPTMARDWPWPDQGPALFVVMDHVQDPGNLGMMIRTAQAAGAHAVGMTEGTVDVFNPKSLRATAGSVFEMPLVELGADWVQAARQSQLELLYSVVDGGDSYETVDWTRPSVLVMGNEGHGVSDIQGGRRISIAMVPTADSLNVASAAAVLLFHAAGVRRRAKLPFMPPRRSMQGGGPGGRNQSKERYR